MNADSKSPVTGKKKDCDSTHSRKKKGAREGIRDFFYAEHILTDLKIRHDAELVDLFAVELL